MRGVWKGAIILDKKKKDRLIKKEIKELKIITQDVDEDKRPYVDRLINQAAFMYATLQELQETINTDGATDLFEQGAQRMLREHPAAKTYNTMIKNYTSIIKTLSDITPQSENEEDPLLSYLAKKKQ